MAEYLITLGIAAVFLGLILIMIGAMASSKESNVHVGVGGFIGPIPFGFANSREMLYVVMAIAVIFVVAFLVLNLRGFF
ncbi:MAG: DUF131 domain-containing protein [Candidatus Aenigmarchaeota archaeon]|nr:DUF131 domain-containing protein [Candidatus Aenigmarchaeota archaeon]